MRQPVRITTDFPSLDEVARAVGVPKSRVKELVELARNGGTVRYRERSAAKKGSTRRARSRGGRS